jgi:hypothetical protein
LAWRDVRRSDPGGDDFFADEPGLIEKLRTASWETSAKFTIGENTQDEGGLAPVRQQLASAPFTK